MLTYRYSELFFSFPHTVRREPNKWRKDILRCLLYDISNFKITCYILLRNIRIEDMLPTSLKGMKFDKFSDDKDEYKLMIFTLEQLRLYILKNKKKVQITKIIDTKIRIFEDEVAIKTEDEDLRSLIKNEVEQKGAKFRTIYS